MIQPALLTSTTEEWATPRAFFAKLDKRYHFTLDPCATADNATCPTYFTTASGRTGERTGCSVIRPMVGRSAHGCASASKRLSAAHLSCYSRPPAPIRG